MMLSIIALLAVDMVDYSQSAFIDGKFAEMQIVHVVTDGADGRIVNAIYAAATLI